MPNKYSESKLVDLYLRAGLEERPLPEIKIRGKQLGISLIALWKRWARYQQSS